MKVKYLGQQAKMCMGELIHVGYAGHVSDEMAAKMKEVLGDELEVSPEKSAAAPIKPMDPKGKGSKPAPDKE